MGVDSLFEIAQRAAVHRSRVITDFGNLPFDLVSPIISKVDNAEQLHQIELNSPEYIGQTSSIWLSLIKRDIPDYLTRRHQPSDPANWYKVYRKLKRDSDADLLASQAALEAELNSEKSAKESKVTHIVRRNELPRQDNPRRKQRINWAYVSGANGSKGASSLSLLEKIRREGNKANAKKMSRPMHELSRGATGVKAAPRDFVDEVRMKVPTSGVRAPRGGQGRKENPGVTKNAQRKEPAVPGGLTAGFLEDDELDSPEEEKSFPLLKAATPTRPPVPTSSTGIKRTASPLPDMRKRKQPPTLFHASPAKVRKN